MIVVDASTVVDALLDAGEFGERCSAAIVGRRLMAPHHFTIEVVSAIRGQYLGGEVTEAKARAALDQLTGYYVRTPRTPRQYLDRIWQLRHNLSAYDAAYVALAEERGCPLVTADARLAAAPGLRCEVRLATAA